MIVHPTAVVGPGVELGTGVEIGPHAVLLGPCRIGDGVRIGAGCPLTFTTASVTPRTVAPGETITIRAEVANAADEALLARLVLDFERSGGFPAGTVVLGERTLPADTGFKASFKLRVRSNAPIGDYALTLGLVDVASGRTCDSRKDTLAVRSAAGLDAGAGGQLFEELATSPRLAALL